MSARSLRAAAAAAVLAAGAPTALGQPAPEPPAHELPGLRLAERAELELRAREPGLRWSDLEHVALVADLDAGELARWTAGLSLRRDGRALVPAAAGTPELHGGAVLGLLFAQWRPEGRPARPEDRYPFRGGAVALGTIYAGHRLQIFLPDLPGLRDLPPSAGGVAEGRLPRMRFFAKEAGAQTVERDAYSLLQLLVAREEDFEASWVNHWGQSLSVERLLRSAWSDYLEERRAEAEREDHSRLHLPEILLAYQRRRAERPGAREPLDPGAIQRRFLSVELARPLSEADDESLVHYAESLGCLLADPRLVWGADERARLRAWLRGLEEERLSDPAALEGAHLTHLVRGLRLLRAHRDRLEGPASGATPGRR